MDFYYIVDLLPYNIFKNDKFINKYKFKTKYKNRIIKRKKIFNYVKLMDYRYKNEDTILYYAGELKDNTEIILDKYLNEGNMDKNHTCYDNDSNSDMSISSDIF